MHDHRPAAVDLRVRFTWTEHGPVTLDEHRHLVVAPLPAAPGVYRWTLTDRPDQSRSAIYIGEGGNLHRRIGNYRRPSTMATAGKLHQQYVAHLTGGGRITLDVATEVEIETAAGTTPLPLIRRTARHLAEHAAIAVAYLDDAVTVLNADACILPGQQGRRPRPDGRFLRTSFAVADADYARTRSTTQLHRRWRRMPVLKPLPRPLIVHAAPAPCQGREQGDQDE